MHEPIRDRLEDLLRAEPEYRPETERHLAHCSECSKEVAGMRVLAEQLGSLRGPEMEPSAGFYARVLQRIDEQESRSFWSFFAESPLSKGLAMASLAISLALGTYMVTQERAEHRQRPVSTSLLAADDRGGAHYDAPVTGSPEEQRDAVLANFVEHPNNQGRIQ